MKLERLLSIIVLVVGFSISGFSLQVEVSGKVISIIDGNTLEFRTIDNETFTFVLAGIDCPELDQEFGPESKRYLEKILLGKEATLIIERKDRFGNKVGGIRLLKGEDPRVELLEKGLAWTQEKNPNIEFEALKEAAKNKGRGLWKQENPTAPWTFRRQQSMLAAKAG
jgi:endonuclease YncB( thermonuclease family)